MLRDLGRFTAAFFVDNTGSLKTEERQKRKTKA